MDPISLSCPRARAIGLLTEQAGDETIVYDEDRKEAHSLNRTAALVWRHCDGNHSVSRIAALVASELGGEADETLVHYALSRLASAHLLERESSGADDGVARREAVRRLAALGAAAIAVPAVLSIVAPTPAMAASTAEPPPDPGADG